MVVQSTIVFHKRRKMLRRKKKGLTQNAGRKRKELLYMESEKVLSGTSSSRLHQ